MTGPEHYREAERILTMLGDADPNWVDQWGPMALGEAQAHATLAQVAATMDLVGATVNRQVSPGWGEAIRP